MVSYLEREKHVPEHVTLCVPYNTGKSVEPEYVFPYLAAFFSRKHIDINYDLKNV
jgi:hypothetical protein